MAELEDMKQGVMALVFVAVIAAALVIALDGFQDSIEDGDGICTNSSSYFNTTSGLCEENSTSALRGGAVGSTTYQYNVTQEGLEGTANATSYLSTIGTLLGVAALILVVMGAFYLVSKRE